MSKYLPHITSLHVFLSLFSLTLLRDNLLQVDILVNKWNFASDLRECLTSPVGPLPSNLTRKKKKLPRTGPTRLNSPCGFFTMIHLPKHYCFSSRTESDVASFSPRPPPPTTVR